MRMKQFMKDIIRKAEYVFLLLAIPFCLIYSILIVPAGGGFDEYAHTARTQSILNGDYLFGPIFQDEASIQETNLAVPINDELWQVTFQNQQIYYGSKGEQFAFPIWQDERILSDVVMTSSYSQQVILGAMVYNPLIYLPYCIGYVAGDLVTDNVYVLLMVMRFFGIAAFCLCTFWAIRLLPTGKWPFVVLALTPNTLASICTITADVVTISSCYLLFAIILRIVVLNEDLTRKNCLILAIATLLISVSKMTYAPLLLLIWLLPICRKNMRVRKNMIKECLIFGIGVLICASWYACIRDINTSALIAIEMNPSEQLHNILSHPISYVSILFKAFVAQDIFAFDMAGITTYVSEFPSPSGALLIVALAVSFLCIRSRKASDTDTVKPVFIAVLCWAVFFCTALLIFTALYLQLSFVGSAIISGVQPRYFAPILPLLVMPFVLLVKGAPQKQSSADQSVIRMEGVLSVVLAVNTLLFLIWALLVTY